MASNAPKQYDLVLLGATGYTGKLCAEHITTSLPSSLKWAVAGRSEAKLSNLVRELKSLNPDREQLGCEVVSLVSEDLDHLVKKTKVVLNTVGPFHLYSTPVVEACAMNGTHYLDVTGETPWVLEMIKKYHATAKANHAIVIPEIGIESCPADLLAWSLVQRIRDECSTSTEEVIAAAQMSGMFSGGSFATIISLFENYSMTELAESSKSWALSPVPGPKALDSTSLFTKVFGVRYLPKIGSMTTSIFGGSNVAIVQRSWGLHDRGALYGPKFQYHEYMSVRNTVTGIVMHLGLALGAIAMLLSPVRWLFAKLVYAPGEGVAKESHSKEYLDYRAIATADQDGPNPRRAFGRFRYDGGLYYLTGLLLAEAAMILLNENDLVAKLDGGVLTPAMLGQSLIDRLKKAGVALETEMLPE